MGKIGENLASLLRKTALIPIIALPLAFGGCEPEDTTPPEIYIYSPEGKSYNSNTVPLEWKIIEENFNSAWYSTDNGQTKYSLEQSGKKDLNLSNGTYNLFIFADDQEENSSTKKVNFSMDKFIPMEINPFISPDANGAPYNALDTREKRDAYIQEKLNEDWDNTIPYSLNLWNCAHYLMQLFVNSHYLGEGVLMPNSAYGDYLLYNGNKSKDLELIYKNHWTLADMGSLGIPMVCVYLTDKTHGDYFGHGMNGVSTGYDITKWEDWNFIEPQTDETNIKIGDLKMPKKGEPYIPKKGETYIPKNCDEVSIEYYYVIKDKFNGKYYLDVTWLVRFKIENGIPILIGVNDDPDFIIKKQREK